LPLRLFRAHAFCHKKIEPKNQGFPIAARAPPSYGNPRLFDNPSLLQYNCKRLLLPSEGERNLFRLMKPEQKSQLIQNIVNAMKTVPKEIQERQVRHFYKADPAYGEGVSKGLGLSIPKA
jgi:Catalase-related immune-responsive